MTRLWRLLVRWLREPVVDPTDTQRARERLAGVERDDLRVERLDALIRRKQRENNLGPQISRPLRARRP